MLNKKKRCITNEKKERSEKKNGASISKSIAIMDSRTRQFKKNIFYVCVENKFCLLMKQYGSQSYRYHLFLLQLYKKERGNLKSAFIESDLKPIIN
jgi:hypothetical protein